MDITKALEIIEALSQGIDPHTGKIYPPDSPYQHPDTTGALFEAIHALEKMLERSKRQESLPEKAGKAWSLEEDNLLIEQFDRGVSVRELSGDHKRTEGAIRSRLLKLGKISPTDITKHAI
jgi:predicted RNA-binding protein